MLLAVLLRRCEVVDKTTTGLSYTRDAALIMTPSPQLPFFSMLAMYSSKEPTLMIPLADLISNPVTTQTFTF